MRYLRIILLLLFSTVAATCCVLSVYVVFFEQHDISLPAEATGIRNGADGCYLRSGQGDASEEERIVAFHDAEGRRRAVESQFDCVDGLLDSKPGDGSAIVVLRTGEDGEPREIRLGLSASRPATPRVARLPASVKFARLIWIPFLCLGAGILIGLLKPGDRHGFRAAGLFLLLPALYSDLPWAYFPGIWKQVTALYDAVGFLLGPYLFLMFALHFPEKSVIERRAPWIKHALLAWLLLGVGFQLVRIHSFESSRLAGELVRSWIPLRVLLHPVTYFSCIAGMFALGGISLGVGPGDDDDEPGRRRRLLLSRSALAGLPGVYIGLVGMADLDPPVWTVVLSCLIIGLFPASFVYVVVRHRVLGVRLILRRSLQYALLSRGFLVVEAALVFLLAVFALGPRLATMFPERATQAASLGALAVAVVAALMLARVNRRVMPVIDRRFFREAYQADQILIGLGRAVRDLATRPEELLPTITTRISQSLHPRHVAAYLPAELISELHLDPALSKEDAGNDAARLLRVAARHEPGSPLPPPVLRERPETADDELVVPIGPDGQMGRLVLGSKLSEEPYSGRDRELLHAVAEQTGAALEHARLIRQVADQEKLQRELEIAQSVQAKLMPQQPPPLGHLRCAGFCRPARGVGGDYYDFLELEPGLLGLALGDISGKGISAALLMANLQALLRGRAPMHGREVERVAADINRLLLDSTEANRYATFFYAVFDDSTRVLRYVNAGHNPPLILRGTGGENAPDPIALEATGMVVGLLEGQEYAGAEVQLRPGDLLLVFSDGVTEAQGADEEEFGERRFVEVASAHAGRDVEEIGRRIVDELTRFAGNHPQHDDQTLIVAKVV